MCDSARGVGEREGFWSHIFSHVRHRKDVWNTDVESVLGAALARLRNERPLTQEDGATGTAFSNAKVTGALQKVGEIRGVSCNITWTPALRASAGSPSMLGFLFFVNKKIGFMLGKGVHVNEGGMCDVPVCEGGDA